MRPKKSGIDAVMKTAENRQAHIARIPRPHLAQEFKERNQEDHAESITFALLPHARMCARGETRSGFLRRHSPVEAFRTARHIRPNVTA